jgi:hypothetical protein
MFSTLNNNSFLNKPMNQSILGGLNQQLSQMSDLDDAKQIRQLKLQALKVWHTKEGLFFYL